MPYFGRICLILGFSAIRDRSFEKVALKACFTYFLFPTRKKAQKAGPWVFFFHILLDPLKPLTVTWSELSGGG